VQDPPFALAGRLAGLEAEGLLRQRRSVEHVASDGVHCVADGRELLSFCSNDYLGLAQDARVAAALSDAAREHGAGAGASHLVSGHHREHDALEEELAAFTGRERALLFSTGYMANLGVVAALAGRGDAVFEDRLNHASLLDAGLLSGARFSRFPHADADALEARLAGCGRMRRLVLTDGVFSMDGDVAPLGPLAAACRRQSAWLMVDDAHGLGVLGPGGRGSLELHGLGPDDVPVLVGTLGKALGTFGAFVAGSADLIAFLIQRARTYIYTTALPPAVAAATRRALALSIAEPWRREHVLGLVARFRRQAAQARLPLADSTTPIQPVLVGEAQAAVAASERLLAQGLLVPAIRPPTVPAGSARLRVTFSAGHTDQQVDRLVDALVEALADTSAGDREADRGGDSPLRGQSPSVGT